MNNCGCVLVEDYDGPEFYYSKLMRARKAHRCDECRAEIRCGQDYERVSGKWDGHVDTFKTCTACLSLRTVFFCDGFLHSGLMDALRHHVDAIDGQISSECILKLTPRARDVVFGIIEDVWASLEEYAEDD